MMAFLAAALALTVDLVLPRYHQNPGDCRSNGSIELKDLDSIYVYVTPRGYLRETLLVALRVRGFEGMTFSFEAPDPSTLRIYTTNLFGHRSCDMMSTVSTVATDVTDPGPPPNTPTVWYDIAGRRLRTQPVSPGIYVRIRGKEVRKLVILK